MMARNIGILQNYAEFKEDFNHPSGSTDSSLHNHSGAGINDLERTTPGRADLARMAGRGSDNFIRWCTYCKHEIPEHLEIDVCDLCGGEVVEIN